MDVLKKLRNCIQSWYLHNKFGKSFQNICISVEKLCEHSLKVGTDVVAKLKKTVCTVGSFVSSLVQSYKMFKIFEALGVLSIYKLNKQHAKIWYAHASSSPNPPPSVGKLVQYIYFNNSVDLYKEDQTGT